jgi:hypothetical protein
MAKTVLVAISLLVSAMWLQDLEAQRTRPTLARKKISLDYDRSLNRLSGVQFLFR